MIQIRSTVLWLLIFLVGVAAIVPDSGEAILAKAVQAATGQWAGPDLDDLTNDAAPLDQANALPPSLSAQPQHGLAFSDVLPSATPRVLSLRV